MLLELVKSLNYENKLDCCLENINWLIVDGEK